MAADGVGNGAWRMAADGSTAARMDGGRDRMNSNNPTKKIFINYTAQENIHQKLVHINKQNKSFNKQEQK
jgi:hypothetical protein